jgi:hypothetical protein
MAKRRPVVFFMNSHSREDNRSSPEKYDAKRFERVGYMDHAYVLRACDGGFIGGSGFPATP